MKPYTIKQNIVRYCILIIALVWWAYALDII